MSSGDGTVGNGGTVFFVSSSSNMGGGLGGCELAGGHERGSIQVCDGRSARMDRFTGSGTGMQLNKDIISIECNITYASASYNMQLTRLIRQILFPFCKRNFLCFMQQRKQWRIATTVF